MYCEVDFSVLIFLFAVNILERVNLFMLQCIFDCFPRKISGNLATPSTITKKSVTDVDFAQVAGIQFIFSNIMMHQFKITVRHLTSRQIMEEKFSTARRVTAKFLFQGHPPNELCEIMCSTSHTFCTNVFVDKSQQ